VSDLWYLSASDSAQVVSWFVGSQQVLRRPNLAFAQHDVVHERDVLLARVLQSDEDVSKGLEVCGRLDHEEALGGRQESDFVESGLELDNELAVLQAVRVAVCHGGDTDRGEIIRGQTQQRPEDQPLAVPTQRT